MVLSVHEVFHECGIPPAAAVHSSIHLLSFVMSCVPNRANRFQAICELLPLADGSTDTLACATAHVLAFTPESAIEPLKVIFQG